MDIVLRPARPEDWPGIVALNNAEVPNVGPLTDESGAWYRSHADTTVAEVGGVIVAVLVVLYDGSNYTSPNYGWFAERRPSFAYVDRVAVAVEHKGRGIGRRLYDHAAGAARALGKPLLTAEVNLEPRNDASLAFHAACGFVQVGEQVDERYGSTVAMLERPLAAG